MSVLKPTRFKFIKKRFANRTFTILDVGTGNTARLTKQWFPHCAYYGLDRSLNHEEFDLELRAMDKFFELDLTSLSFDQIPDNFFDLIMMSHIIEHLQNGDKVIERLLPKLNKGGAIYVEFPSERSTKFPSLKGTLNFYDDPTHCRIYTIREISALLTQHKLRVLRSGVSRDLKRILLLPLLMLSSKIKLGYVSGSVFWDLLGFAEYVYAEKD